MQPRRVSTLSKGAVRGSEPRAYIGLRPISGRGPRRAAEPGTYRHMQNKHIRMTNESDAAAGGRE